MHSHVATFSNDSHSCSQMATSMAVQVGQVSADRMPKRSVVQLRPRVELVHTPSVPNPLAHQMHASVSVDTQSPQPSNDKHGSAGAGVGGLGVGAGQKVAGGAGVSVSTGSRCMVWLPSPTWTPGESPSVKGGSYGHGARVPVRTRARMERTPAAGSDGASHEMPKKVLGVLSMVLAVSEPLRMSPQLVCPKCDLVEQLRWRDARGGVDSGSRLPLVSRTEKEPTGVPASSVTYKRKPTARTCASLVAIPIRRTVVHVYSVLSPNSVMESEPL
mmetsp:Transcript_6821/g.21967  ORF Transcript_6821/g.21967 Transcript_6821/m.21967 type:complete len:273 (+) Transcript_6821:690-1508(+)